MTDKAIGLALLRASFPEHQISKLPKPTKKQTEELRADFKKGKRCALCGGWHQPDVVHLDYVGHAALTDRLLDADPAWQWEPLAMSDTGLPVMDGMGGMWIRLTVCGVTRLGYGHAGDKSGGDAIKEVIGDALRNAAMRFGAALELWHKGTLHDDAGGDGDKPEVKENKPPPAPDLRITPAKATAELTPISDEQRAYVQEVGADMVAAWNGGKEGAALSMWRTISDNDIKIHLWHWLQSESKLRSFLNANKLPVPAKVAA